MDITTLAAVGDVDIAGIFTTAVGPVAVILGTVATAALGIGLGIMWAPGLAKKLLKKLAS